MQVLVWILVRRRTGQLGEVPSQGVWRGRMADSLARVRALRLSCRETAGLLR